MKLDQWAEDIEAIVDEWEKQEFLSEGDLFVIGCSTSEVAGERIGTSGSEEVAAMIFEKVQQLKQKIGVDIAFQCCEHLNRALVVEKKVMRERGFDPVSVVPVRKAGGSMAAYAFEQLEDAVVVENVRADAGIDIGETMIGMHLKPVVVPLRLKQRWVGHARVNSALTRPKLIGGPRAVYAT
ncbi:TIGR01440 family protein [Gracilibacillus sp. YIM 98692]|uniref:TIGR01440 family protein n=1 Tax=Gracilibacillus sp. YIM 98692 TaxID=2663532 RepID=UPI0013D20896|nr:TIGR01440 family protein [Gracilibacillus sp. YIM 98692]